MQAAVTAHCYDADPDRLLDDDYLLGASKPAPDSYRNRYGATDTWLGGNKAVNFYNPVDYALGYWIVNELLFKPDLNYQYIAATGKSFHMALTPDIDGFGTWQSDYEVTNEYEILAFVARPRAHAAGVQGATAGAVDISKGKNLNALLGFADVRADHSGQFTRDFVNVRDFYHFLLDSFDIPHTEP